MPYLELLWIPAVLGWIPLIYADELSARFGLAAKRGSDSDLQRGRAALAESASPVTTGGESER